MVTAKARVPFSRNVDVGYEGSSIQCAIEREWLSQWQHQAEPVGASQDHLQWCNNPKKEATPRFADGFLQRI
ncbi:MAG: hypothetical protein CL915_03865 [Deltaproteobacteria bacterium]|nr:hypothetical protein [Deltaproteobacteria bacterium]